MGIFFEKKFFVFLVIGITVFAGISFAISKSTGNIALAGTPNPNPGHTLDQLAMPSTCTSGQVLKINAIGNWDCGDDATSGGGGGDITGVTAGTGLSGGGTTGDVTISADLTLLQRRVSSFCSAGSSIREISSDGTVTCETDDIGGGGGISCSSVPGCVHSGTWCGLTIQQSNGTSSNIITCNGYDPLVGCPSGHMRSGFPYNGTSWPYYYICSRT